MPVKRGALLRNCTRHVIEDRCFQKHRPENRKIENLIMKTEDRWQKLKSLKITGQ